MNPFELSTEEQLNIIEKATGLKTNDAVAEEENTLAKQILDFENEILIQENTLKELKNKKEESSYRLLNLMIERGVKTWETPNKIKFTVVEPKEPETKIVTKFNEDKLKELNPELYESCLEKIEKISNGRKGYLRITVPKEGR